MLTGLKMKLTSKFFLVILVWAAWFPVIHAQESGFFSVRSAQQKKPLPAEEAFQVSAQKVSESLINIHWQVAPGYYLYQPSIQVNTETENTFLELLPLPEGKMKNDIVYGDVAVYFDDLLAQVRVKSDAQTFKINVVYQGCLDQSICYPVMTKTFSFEIGDTSDSGPASKGAVSDEWGAIFSEAGRSDRLATMLSQSFWLALGAFFLLGLLASLTPCVLPMIPILSSLILSHQDVTPNRFSFKGLKLSFAYVLGMASTYGLIGFLAAQGGGLITPYFQQSWLLVMTALIFVFLSLSMLGCYEIRLPQAIQNKLLSYEYYRRGGLFWLWLTGALASLIVSPCVVAPLAAAVLFITQTNDTLLGISALFVLAMGMGVPLLLIGTMAGRLLIKSGSWMVGVQRLIGLLMLATAWWIVRPIFSESVWLVGWGVFSLLLAVFIETGLKKGLVGFGHLLLKTVFLISLLFGSAVIFFSAFSLVMQALSPASSVLQPNISSERSSEEFVEFKVIDTDAKLQSAIQSALPQFSFVEVYANWCVSCVEFERKVLNDPEVWVALSSFQKIRLDLSDFSQEKKQLLNQLELIGPPAHLFFDREGNELRDLRVIGDISKKEFLLILQQVK